MTNTPPVSCSDRPRERPPWSGRELVSALDHVRVDQYVDNLADDLLVNWQTLASWLRTTAPEVGTVSSPERKTERPRRYRGGRTPGRGGQFSSRDQALVVVQTAYRRTQQNYREEGYPDVEVSVAAVARTLNRAASTLHWWLARWEIPWPPFSA
jgi:hypothetical protein